MKKLQERNDKCTFCQQKVDSITIPENTTIEKIDL